MLGFSEEKVSRALELHDVVPQCKLEKDCIWVGDICAAQEMCLSFVCVCARALARMNE